MNERRFNYTTATVLTIVMTFLFCVSGTSVSAQSIGKTSDSLENERISRIMDPNANIEEFRTEMKNYLTDLGNALSNFEAIPAVREQFSKDGLNPVGGIERVKSNLDKMSAEDLVKMREAYSKSPNWRQAPRAIYEISQKVINKTYAPGKANKKSGDTTPNVITPDGCPNISATPSFADIAITEAFLIAADAIMEALPTDFLTILGREIAVAIRAGLKGAVLAVETLRSQYDACQGDEFEAAIQDQVTTSTNSIISNDNSNTTNIVSNDNINTTNIVSNDNANKTTIVNNDNANKTTIVNNDNANTLALTNLINASRIEIINNANDNRDETNNLLLRTQIEADLSSTDGSTFVALYETPRTVCLPSLNQRGLPQIGALSNPVQCGLLDLVRSIVRDTIANVNSSSTAASFFAQGDAQRANGEYKAAYTSYRKAYKAASK